MKLHLIACGRIKAGPEKALFEHYAERLKPPLSVREVEEKKRLEGAELKAREADLLLDAVPQGAVIIALDERGRDLTSPELAKKIGAWRDDGRRDAAFLIGGADGLDGAVRKRADLVLNLGKLTWPHMLVRGLLAEQLFRTQCILSGHPYHRL